MKLHRPQAFAGFLIISLIALIGFAAFSATGLRTAPPLDLPEGVSASVAAQILGVDLGPDAADPSLTPPRVEPAPDLARQSEGVPVVETATTGLGP